jgi:riboflavin synthase
MFTGIVESTGIVAGAVPIAAGRRLRVEHPAAADCKHGDSICVSGVCLTVAGLSGNTLDFDVVRETLDRSTLGQKRAGDRVNIERSLRVGDRLDGHFVQGHVDGTAVVEAVAASPGDYVVWFRPQEDLLPYVIPKGSIAIDGVSLTIAAIEGPTFSIALIPTTLERTSLGAIRRGDRVNVETDVIARTIVHRLSEITADGSPWIDTLKASFA